MSSVVNVHFKNTIFDSLTSCSACRVFEENLLNLYNSFTFGHICSISHYFFDKIERQTIFNSVSFVLSVTNHFLKDRSINLLELLRMKKLLGPRTIFENCLRNSTTRLLHALELFSLIEDVTEQ